MSVSLGFMNTFIHRDSTVSNLNCLVVNCILGNVITVPLKIASLCFIYFLFNIQHTALCNP